MSPPSLTDGGVGTRRSVFWFWWLRQEMQRLMLDYIESISPRDPSKNQGQLADREAEAARVDTPVIVEAVRCD